MAAELRARPGPHGAGLRFTAEPWLVAFLLHCPAGDAYPHLPKGLPLGPENPNTPSHGDGLLCPNATQLARFRRAVADGAITWQAFPFAGQPEILDGELFAWAITNITHAIDDELHVPHKTVFSTRDVPGLSRAAVPWLVRSGVIGISVGANTGSSPPGVPSVLDTAQKGGPSRAFLWRDEGSGTEVIANFHGGGYAGFGGQNLYAQDMLGDCVIAEGLDEAMCYSWMGDNQGPPPTADIVRGHWQTLQAMFPNAEVVASDLDAFYAKLDAPEIKAKLEVLTSEVGDTWIFNKAGQPWEAAVVRLASRLRKSCATAHCGMRDEKWFDFNRYLSHFCAHTIGRDCPMPASYFVNWSNAWLEETRRTENRTADNTFASCERGQYEQRLILYAALDATNGTTFGETLRSEIEKLEPLPPPTPSAEGWRTLQCSQWGVPIALSPGIELTLNTSSGSVVGCGEQHADWASPGQPLHELWYQMESYAQEVRWALRYRAQGFDPWYQGGEPKAGLMWTNVGLDNQSEKRVFMPALRRVQVQSKTGGASKVLLTLDFPERAKSYYGAPRMVYVLYEASAPDTLDAKLLMSGKGRTRMPEHLWVSFRPPQKAASDCHWIMDKMGSPVIFNDTVVNGSKYLHATGEGGVRRDCLGENPASLQVRSLDPGSSRRTGKPTCLSSRKASRTTPRASPSSSMHPATAGGRNTSHSRGLVTRFSLPSASPSLASSDRDESAPKVSTHNGSSALRSLE